MKAAELLAALLLLVQSTGCTVNFIIETEYAAQSGNGTIKEESETTSRAEAEIQASLKEGL